MNDDRTPTITADTQLSAPKSMPPPRPEKLNKSLIAETRTPANPDLTVKNKDGQPFNTLETEVARRLLQMPRLSVPLFSAALSRDRQLNFQPFFSALGVPAPADPKKTSVAGQGSAAKDALNRLQISSVAGIYQFQRGVSLPYMRKSLALNYEHVNLTKSLVALTGSMAQMLEAKLEAIKLNTAAPDSKKSESLWEQFRLTQRQMMLTKAATFVSAKTNVLAKAAYAKAKPYLEERLYKPAAENYKAYRAGTKSASDIMAEAQAAARKAYEDGINQYAAWRNRGQTKGPSLAEFMADRNRDAPRPSSALQIEGPTAPLRLMGPMPSLKPPIPPAASSSRPPPRPASPIIDHNENDVIFMHPEVQAQQFDHLKRQNRDAKSSSGKQGCLDCCDDLIKRLDNIHNLMKTHFTRQEKTSLDTLKTMQQEEQRGEGPRAGSYADHMRELLARRKAGAAAGFGAAAGAAGGVGGTAPEGGKSASGGGSSSWLSEVLGTTLGGLVGGKFSKYAGNAGKGLWSGAKAAGRRGIPGLGALGAMGWNAFKDGGKLTGSLASSLMGSVSSRSLSPLGHWLSGLTGSGAAGAATKGAVEGAELGGSTLFKTLGKKIPGIGALIGAGLSIKDLFDGEYVNAAGDLASGLVSTIPGIGTGASLALDGAMLYRNLNRTKPTTMPKAPEGPQKPGMLSRALYGTQAEVSNGRVVKKAEDSIVGKMWADLFGSKTEQTADGQIVKDGQLGVIGHLRHGVAQTLRFMSNSIFGQYDADGNRIQGSSYLEQSEAALAKAWGRGKSIIEQTAAGLKRGVSQFGGFLFGGEGRKDIVSRTWDSITSTVSDWGKTLNNLASSAWTGIKNAPGAVADAAKAVGQHVADTVAAIPQAASDVKDALKNAPGAAYDAIKSGASSVVGGVKGATSYLYNKVTGGTPSEGNNSLEKMANSIDAKPGTTTVQLPNTAPGSSTTPPPFTPSSYEPASNLPTGGVASPATTPGVAGGSTSSPAQVATANGSLPTGVVGDGQCVALVKKVAGIGATATWSPGDSVLGSSNIKPGTVIATFGEGGKYENRTDGSSHAAIYLGPSLTKPGGIRVYDQWKGHPASVRDIGLSGSPVNNAKYFRVVTTASGVAQTAAVDTSLPSGGVTSAGSDGGSTPQSVSSGGGAVASATLPPMGSGIQGGGVIPASAVASSPDTFTPHSGSDPFPTANTNHLPGYRSNRSAVSGPVSYTPPTYSATPPLGGMPATGGPVSSPPAAGGKSGGAAPAPITGGSFAQKGPQIAARLQADFGLTPVQAAGIVGNLGHESGGFKQLQEVNPIGGGRGGLGWAQWTGPRRVEFEKFAAANGMDTHSDEANYAFLKHELQTTQKSAITAVKQTNDVGSAVSAFEAKFERANPKYVHLESREKYANIALAGAGSVQMASNGVAPPPASPSSPSGPGGTAAAGLPASGVVPVSTDPSSTPAAPTQMAAASPTMIPTPAVITNGVVTPPSAPESDSSTPSSTDTPAATPAAPASAAAQYAAVDPSMMEALHGIKGAISDMHTTIASGKMMGSTNDLLQAHLDKPNTVVSAPTNNNVKGGGSKDGDPQNDLDFSKAVKDATATA